MFSIITSTWIVLVITYSEIHGLNNTAGIDLDLPPSPTHNSPGRGVTISLPEYENISSMESAEYVFVLNNSYPLASIVEFCPLKTQYSPHFIGIPPCCIPCDSTASCVARGTCCNDVQKREEDQNNTYNSTEPKERCVRTFIGDSPISDTGFVRKLGTYWLIQSCPDEYNHHDPDSSVRKCIRPNETVYEEMTPVYSHTTKINYRNRFCAICNRDTTNLTDWWSKFLCNDYTNLLKLFQNDAYRGRILLESIRKTRGCIVEWEPLISERYLHCVDDTMLISECLASDYFDEETAKNCDALYSPVKGGEGIYKNIFCLACNEGVYGYRVICNSENLNFVSKELTFTTLLDLNGNIEQPYPQMLENQLLKCSAGFQYDPLLDDCIQETCPISFLNFGGGNCLPVMKKVRGVGFDYRIKLMYTWNTFRMPPLDEIRNNLQPLVVHEHGSRLCSLHIISVLTEGDVVTVKIQLTKFGDDFYDIENEYKQFHNKVRHAQKHMLKDPLVELDVSPFEPIDGDHLHYGKYTDFVNTGDCNDINIAVAELQTCRTIQITNFTKTEKDEIITEKAYFLPGEYISKIDKVTNESIAVYVCHKLYRRRMNAMNLSQIGHTNACERLKCYIRVFIFLLVLAYTTTAFQKFI